MIKDEIEAESTTSAHFSISHQFEPASAQVTSDTAFTMSSPPTRRNINWRHSQSDFFRKNLRNGGVNCCKNAEIWLAEKISIFWSDFPSESKLTTLNESCTRDFIYVPVTVENIFINFSPTLYKEDKWPKWFRHPIILLLAGVNVKTGNFLKIWITIYAPYRD
jgi:hypothetical protein